MNEDSDMEPAVDPGEVLAEHLRARGLTQIELARRMDRPVQVINEIVRGKKRITAETALQLERVLGIRARYWLQVQADHDLSVARKKARTA